MGGNSKTLLISIILTAFAVLLIYTYVQQKDAQLTADLGVMVDVLVANRNIPENTNFEETMVSMRSMPKKFVEPNFLSSPSDVLNTVAAIPIAQGETITTNKLLFKGVKTGLAPIVAKGKRAISIRASSFGASNLLKPGDRIDIIVVQVDVENNNTTTTAKTVLQDVFILSVGDNIHTQPLVFERARRGEFSECVQKEVAAEAAQISELTVELTPKEAQVIAALSTSQLYYTLRNPDDRTNEVITTTTDKDVLN